MADVFRKAYRQLTPNEVSALDAIKSQAQELYNMLDLTAGDGRSLALAKTKLEEVVMWAVKGITG